MARKVSTLSLVMLCLVVVLAGCGSDEVEKTGTVLTINGTEYYQSEIEAMDQVTITATHPKSGEVADYTGVSLLNLLDDAGLAADTITAVASDGYEVEIVMAEIPDTALLVIEDGTYRLIMPDMSSSAWAKEVVEIR